jgi:hypothetical protein
MSKKPAKTPPAGKPGPAVTAGPGPLAAPAPPAPCCETCAHWGKVREAVGECRQGPPTVPTDFVPGAPGGRLHVYPLTPAALPACGRYLARA